MVRRTRWAKGNTGSGNLRAPMDRPPCRYCVLIREHAPGYRVQRATHGPDSSHPRCDVHWRFVCAKCGSGRHYHAMSFCPSAGSFYCIECAPDVRTAARRFWAWSYSYRLRCPWRAEWHEALDRLEFEGRHPWQTHPAWRRRRHGMDPAEDIPPRWSFRVAPAKEVTDVVIREGWDAVARWWVSRYGPRGDLFREWIIDPVLFKFLGDVRGQRVLDAGCGGGYLARMLAERGARVDAVDISQGLLAEARAEERRHPLGIRYHRSDLANLSRFAGRTFDACVSNIVLQDVRRYREAIRELARVLKPRGRFVFSITHPAFEAPVPGQWLREPPDTERIEERRYLTVDRYFDRVGVYWAPPGKPLVPGFHRPLRDYFEALHAAGLEVTRLEEPGPSSRALKRHYRAFADLLRVPIFLVIEARKATGRNRGRPVIARRGPRPRGPRTGPPSRSGAGPRGR